MAQPARDLDVVVFGAGGVTGRQVAAYLAGAGARWAAAGRDPVKIERTLAELGVSAPETLAADVGDPASLEAMAARTKVVLDLVGPYTLYGEPVIAACVASGAHYADLTGEIPFVREIIDRYDAAAAAAGVKIVQVAGFEALPADLGVRLAAVTARERWGDDLAAADVSFSVAPPPGLPHPADWISGGTFQSIAEIVGAPAAEVAADPAALVGDPDVAAAIRLHSPIAVSPRRGPDGEVIAPMAPAAFINPAVIQRTWALAAAEAGGGAAPFRYREGVEIPGPGIALPVRLAIAASLGATQAAIRTGMRARPAIRARVASGLRAALPSSGFGPTGERLEGWRWKFKIVAETTAGHALTVRIEAEGHPGYLATARMLGEAGLMIAAEGLTPDRSGCLTPALALGTGALERFERAGMRFSVD